MKKKYISLQILRGIAAWMVVYHHYLQTFRLTDSLSFLGRIVWGYGDFGVDIFFVLSGFVMYWSAQNKKYNAQSFFLNRAFRIFPVYWFYTILIILSLLILPKDIYLTGCTYSNILKSFVLFPCSNPSGYGTFPILYVGWTLMYEMAFYSILSLSIFLSRRFALYICIFIMAVTPLILGKWGFFGHNNFLFYEFLAGLLLAGLYKKVHGFFNRYNFFIVLFFLAGVILITHFFKWDIQVKIFVSSFILIIFLGLEKIFQIETRIFKFFEKLGDISYSTYLVHPIILGWYYAIFRDQSSFIIQIITISLIGITAYYLSIFSFKNIEVGKWVSDLKRETNATIASIIPSVQYITSIRGIGKIFHIPKGSVR